MVLLCIFWGILNFLFYSLLLYRSMYVVAGVPLGKRRGQRTLGSYFSPSTLAWVSGAELRLAQHVHPWTYITCPILKNFDKTKFIDASDLQRFTVPALWRRHTFSRNRTAERFALCLAGDWVSEMLAASGTAPPVCPVITAASMWCSRLPVWLSSAGVG